jgi:hypothetical protein
VIPRATDKTPTHYRASNASTKFGSSWRVWTAPVRRARVRKRMGSNDRAGPGDPQESNRSRNALCRECYLTRRERMGRNGPTKDLGTANFVSDGDFWSLSAQSGSGILIVPPKQ